jgi:hypothetical protein
MPSSRPANHLKACSCAVCVKIRAPKSTKLLLTLYVDQHEYLQNYGRKIDISTSEVIRRAIEFFRGANPLDKVKKKEKTLMEVLLENE